MKNGLEQEPSSNEIAVLVQAPRAPIFVVALTPFLDRDGRPRLDPHFALKKLLKFASRALGLRCISVRQDGGER
jgi:hypothetical protein